MKRPHITYANAMATIALFATLGGTAMAAVMITGFNVKDNTLTNWDVKTYAFSAAELSAAARTSLLGVKGNTGLPGSRGSTGLTGITGQQGPRGSAAFMTSAFAFRNTNLVTQRTNSLTPNDGPGATGHDWDDPNYASAAGGFQTLRTLQDPATYQAINLTSTMQPMIALTGMTGTADLTRSTDTSLNLTFTDGHLNATATLTLLHRRDGEDLATNSGGTLLNGRATCALFYGTNDNPALLTQIAGAPAYVSSGGNGLNHELVQVSLNGAANGLTTGTEYNLTVKCRDADFTGSTQWQLVSGNLTGLISR